MIHKENQGVHWLEFNLLANVPRVTHGVFLKHGGVSQGLYSSLNLSDSTGDELKHVIANRTKVAKILGVDILHWTKQCHGSCVNELVDPRQAECFEGDALTTSQTGLGLVIGHADCQATIIYDPVRHVVANVHSGWRGSVQNIYKQTVEFMKAKYNSNPKDLLACISPSLGPDHSQFINYRTELPEVFWDFQTRPEYFDFWAISERQLEQCGVLRHHIEIARICTYANPKDYFSYRRDKAVGRHGTIVALL